LPDAGGIALPFPADAGSQTRAACETLGVVTAPTWHYGVVARWWAEFNTTGPDDFLVFTGRRPAELPSSDGRE
jgi:hypothetical protein